MPNSLNTAVSGLLAHQRQLDMVANNLANMNTTGYKSQRIVFSDLMYELLSPATSGNGISVGGTNPIQLGSGVKTGQIGRDFGQGGFNSTGQPLDFALQGDGFFVVTNGDQSAYTRAGAFTLDQNGYLIDPSTGYHVRRFGSAGEPGTGPISFQIPGDDRIRVPLGETILGQATSHVDFQGVLDAQVAGPVAQELISANAFQVAGSPATTGTLLNDLDTNLTDYQAGDEVELSGVNADGSTFSANLVVGPTTTLGDLVTGINTNLSGATASIDSLGNLVVTSDDTGPSMVSVTFRDAVGNVGQTDFHIHSLVANTPGADGETFSGKMDIYDVRGGERSLGYLFQKVGLNTWDLTFTLPDGDGTVVDGTIAGIEFSDDGTLVGVGGITNSLFSVTVDFDDILQQQSFEVDISNLIQIANPFSMSIDQDGLEPGKLANVRVNSDGTLDGISSTGQSFEIAQLAIAIFRNPQGLSAIGNSYFEESLNSGAVELGAAASGGRGAIRGGQLEGSNVDIAFEFTQLIVAQRGFSANARTITVADEVLEELTNIIR